MAVVFERPKMKRIWFATMPKNESTISLRRSFASNVPPGSRIRARSVSAAAPATARNAARTSGAVSARASLPKTGKLPKQSWTARSAR